MPRLGHKKSRLGCRQCKARHVKCDELKPCTNCARHGVQCSLTTDPPPSSALSAETGSSSSSAPKSELKSVPTNEGSKTVATPGNGASEGSSPSSQPDQFQFLRPFIHKPATNQSDLWVQDIELMHHWTIEAYDELSQREDMRYTWRVEAPKVAVTYTFFMHEILAFSAFHKASQNSDKRREYYTLGIHHQDLAIKGMRPKLQTIVPDEAPAIIATSTLLTLGVFASTGFEAICSETPSQSSAIDGILNIFSLMQGMGNILSLAHMHVLDSFLAPMFSDPLEATPPQPLLQELIHHLPSVISLIEAKQDLPDDERAVFLSAVNHFEPVLRLASPARVDNRELRFLFFWPLHLDGSFLASIKQRRSGALVILMYYATMLFVAEPRYWFMNGWGHRLIKACYEEVDKSWLPVLHWPMSFLKPDPTYSLLTATSRLPSDIEVPQGPVSIPYARQPPQTVSFRHYVESPLHSSDHKSLSTMGRTDLYPHPTGTMPPSYATQTAGSSYPPLMYDAYIDRTDQVSSDSGDRMQERGQGAKQKSQKREGS